MVMVSTSESSQCRAVAVPCAWKARRRGCEGDRRGGSVVLQRPVQHMRARRSRRVHSPPQRIQDIPNHAAPLPDLRACLGRAKKGSRLLVEVCDERGVGCGARERGGSFIEQARGLEGRNGRNGSGDRLARRSWRAMAQLQLQPRAWSRGGVEVHWHGSTVRGVQERSRLQSCQVGRYPGVTRTHAHLLADHVVGESACEACRIWDSDEQLLGAL
jgi:hypothetical protein